ncbi:Os07g0643500, partial [Oryza sativa Japonica Group]
VALHERLHLLDELAGVGELREDVEGVDRRRVLHHLHRLPIPPQHPGVPPLPVLQRVVPSDHHHRRRELLRQLGVLAGDVRRRVVAVGALRQERPPAPVRARHAHHRPHAVQPQLRLRPLLAAEERLQQDDAGEADAAARGGGGGGPSVRDVVGDVAAGAVADEEAAGEVDGDGRYYVGGEADGGEVAEHVHAVVVGGGVAVLGGEAVVDGDDDGAELAAEPAAQGVVLAGGGGEEREAAAVEVDDDGERRGFHGAAARGGEHARPQPAGRVDGDIAGADAVGVRARRGGALAVCEGEEEAVDGAVAALHDVDGGDEGEELEPHRPRQRRRLGPPELVAGRFLLLLVPHFAGFCASHFSVQRTLYIGEPINFFWK